MGYRGYTVEEVYDLEDTADEIVYTHLQIGKLLEKHNVEWKEFLIDFTDYAGTMYPLAPILSWLGY